MPIAKMKRLQVLALERDHDALLRQLERMGCVEISEPDAPDAPESLRRCGSETADCLARQRQVQTAIDALRRAAPPKKAPLLAPRPAIGEAEYLSETGLADGLALARQVNEAAGRLQQLTALAAQLETDRITLGPWLSLDLPLELTETRCCDVTLGVLPPFVPWDELCGQVQNEYPESELHLLSADRQQQCVLLITHKAATAPVLELLRGRGFAASPLKGRTGTPEENRRREDERWFHLKAIISRGRIRRCSKGSRRRILNACRGTARIDIAKARRKRFGRPSACRTRTLNFSRAVRRRTRWSFPPCLRTMRAWSRRTPGT